MNKQRIRILAAVSLGVLALTVCLSALAGEPPVCEVILESTSWPVPGEDYWAGPATIWINGGKWDGSVVYMHARAKMNDNSWHGVETQIFDFGDLGTLEVSGTAMTTFDYVSPEHRWHHYVSQAKVTAGTGAFAEATGVFQFEGYTDWQLVTGEGYGWGGATAKIVGIQLPE